MEVLFKQIKAVNNPWACAKIVGPRLSIFEEDILKPTSNIRCDLPSFFLFIKTVCILMMINNIIISTVTSWCHPS